MSLGMSVKAYSGTYETGISRIYTMSKSARYRGIPSSLLIDHGLYMSVGSTKIYRNSTADSNLILFFQNITYVLDYTGYFIQIRHPSDADNFVQKNGHLLNLNCQSMLLVRTNTGNEIRISVKNTFLEDAIQLLEGSLPSVVRRNGDPMFTWEMFPRVTSLDQSRHYLKIHQRLRIKPAIKTYDATVTYHIYLRLDANGTPRATGTRWAYWVEGGVLTNKIANELEPAVADGLDTVISYINTTIGRVTGGARFKDLFYLPGDNTNIGYPQVWGHTNDDVTIVLER